MSSVMSISSAFAGVRSRGTVTAMSTRARPAPVIRRMAREGGAKTLKKTMGTRVRAGGDDEDTDDADDATKPALTKGEYYAGFVNEPIQGVDTGERDVITPTIKLVTQSSVALTILYLGFTYSNNLPPFGPGPTMPMP